MPFFTLHRTFILRTTKGHSIGFEKGRPTWVTPDCVSDAVAIGAVPVEEGEGSVLPPEAGPRVELTPAQREAAIFKAFDLLVARKERGDFTASNMPHCKKVGAITDFEIPIPERDEAWRKYRLMHDSEETA